MSIRLVVVIPEIVVTDERFPGPGDSIGKNTLINQNDGKHDFFKTIDCLVWLKKTKN